MRRLRLALSSLGLLAAFLIVPTVAALPYGTGLYGTCQYDTCSISVSSSGTVGLSATPTAAGVFSTASDTVSVTTAASTGFTLKVNDSDTDTNLVNGANNVAASSGTQAVPVERAANTWGYRVDGLSGFGAGPTSAESSVSSSSYTFAGVPASNQTAHTIRNYTSAASAIETIIWYGVKIDTAIPAGTYTGTVTYTATTN